MFSMVALYSWLQLSMPNMPCPAVRQSLVFVIMASDWGFCYLDLDGGGILGFANWFLWVGGLCTTVDGGSYGWIVMATLRRCCWFVGLCFTMDGCSCIGLLLFVHQ